MGMKPWPRGQRDNESRSGLSLMVPSVRGTIYFGPKGDTGSGGDHISILARRDT